MEFLDTQIISYAMKGRYDESIDGKAISSVVAKEFLLLQSVSPTRATYYIPVFGPRPRLPLTRDSNRPFGRHHTDSILLNLGPEYGAVIEYSDLAIATLIKERNVELFEAATRFFSKEKQRTLKKRLLFLLENQIECVTLSRSAVTTTLDLLADFGKSHNIKANFRNTLNDLMIVASAITSSGILTTVDSELVRFVARYDGRLLRRTQQIVTIDFESASDAGQVRSEESKGFINRGWDVRFRRMGYT